MIPQIPRKNVIKIEESELPKPFSEYWNSNQRLERPQWSFYLVDNELYIKQFDDSLLTHWTDVGCCGVVNFVIENGIEAGKFSLVDENGEYLFKIKYGFYQMIAIKEDGTEMIVYDG